MHTLSFDDTTLLIRGNSVLASYPRYADSIISFEDRLEEIKNLYVRSTLQSIFKTIEAEYIPGVHENRSIDFVEQDLVNYPQRFLYGLAQLYTISTLSQKKYIVDSLILGKVSRIEYL